MNSTLSPDYVVGFVDGEGCFSITVNKGGKEIRLLFEIELREDDREILERIRKTLGCGGLYRLEYKRYKKWHPHVKLKVSNFKDISEKLIPFFKNNPLQAKKGKDFVIFCEVAEMMKNKKHLTASGREAIARLRSSLIK